MRYSFGTLAAAAIAFGLSIAGPTVANAESIMRTCVTEWKQAQTAGTTGGQTWPQFLAQCRTKHGSVAEAPAPAPASQSGSLFPWWGEPAPAAAPASNAGGAATGRQSVMRLCASRWKDAKAAGTTAGQTWPQFLARCRESEGSVAATPSGGGFASAPAPAPAPSQSGSLFPWERPSAPASNTGAPSSRAGEYTTELQAKAQCPSDTVVWANTSSGIYHYSGTRYYGHTRKGAYMCEAQARADGYRASRGREREAQTH